MEDLKITKARYQFSKVLGKLVKKYEDKGMKIKALEIKWDNDTELEVKANK